jgi:hypothetical protein
VRADQVFLKGSLPGPALGRRTKTTDSQCRAPCFAGLIEPRACEPVYRLFSQRIQSAWSLDRPSVRRQTLAMV